MNFAESLRYIEKISRLPRREFLVDRTECQWYLDRMQHLLNLLGNPEQQIPHYLHITGTSGKGSVAIMLASIMRAAGRGPVGLLTSPSTTGLLDRTEINMQTVQNTDFAQAVSTIKNALPRYYKTAGFDTPSVFEMLTVAALIAFAQKKVATAVIEVGLGGRYDSTNIIPHKDAAIITNIGPDHLNIIGPTLRDVAIEKAGIIKAGAKVFTMEKNPAYRKIFARECAKTGTTLNYVRPSAKKPVVDLHGTRFSYHGISYRLSALGAHQANNAVLAITAAHSLGIPQTAIKRGLANAHFPIRMEVVSNNPVIILDGAHNPDKIASTIKTMLALKKNNSKIKNIHLVLGFSADKQIEILLRELKKLFPASIACTRFTNNNHREPLAPTNLARLCKKIFNKNTNIQLFLDPQKALAQGRAKIKTGDVVLVTGSMFLAGELRALFF